MNEQLRIAVADDEADMRQYLQEILRALGHNVVVTARTGRELVERCREARPDLVITDIRMPDMDGLEAAALIYQERPVPNILVTGHDDPQYVERADACHAQAYLVKPIKQTDLGPAIHLAVRRFQQYQEACQESAELRQSLEDRKLIERAKGIVCRRLSLDEPEAFRRLKKLASDRNLKLAEASKLILQADEPFAALESR